MEAEIPDSEVLNEEQSLKMIRGIIEVSRKKLKNDGILFIVWGWAMFSNYLISYIQRTIILTYNLNLILKLLTAGIMVCTFGFTIYHTIRQLNKIQTYIGISLRYVWIGLFFSLVFINIILMNILHVSNLEQLHPVFRVTDFELQHPIFMVFIAFATLITGGILRHRLVICGGIAFALLAVLCSYLKLNEQILVEACAWLIAFIIPGHIMFYTRNS